MAPQNKCIYVQQLSSAKLQVQSQLSSRPMHLDWPLTFVLRLHMNRFYRVDGRPQNCPAHVYFDKLMRKKRGGKM
jgi:hypothetical protein